MRAEIEEYIAARGCDGLVASQTISDYVLNRQGFLACEAMNRKIGRMTKELKLSPYVTGSQVPPVDIITGGFCCQDLSVAGKRAGLNGERSGLFSQVTRIMRKMLVATNNGYPKFAVLENVLGMYSSNGGIDFQPFYYQVKAYGLLSQDGFPKVILGRTYKVCRESLRNWLLQCNEK